MKNGPLIVVSVIFSLLLLGGGVFLLRSPGKGGGGLVNPLGGSGSGGTPSGYQAVFLTNGQVYFGKLAGFPGTAPVLADVFYLRTGPAPMPTPEVKRDPKTGKVMETPPAAAAGPSFTLVKLGEEIHGPTDELRLNSDQILFVEDLRAESPLVAAIKRYKEAQTPKK